MSVTVRQKRPGKGQPWHVFIHAGGLIRSKRIGTRREAEAVASELRRKMAMGEFKLDAEDAPERTAVPEFAAYAQHYLKTHAMVLLKRNTHLGYKVIIEKHLLPSWTGKRLDEIRRRDVKQLLMEKQAAGLAAGTVENIKALISGIFTLAFEEEIILSANPALKLGKFIRKSDAKRHAVFASKEQVAKLLQAAEEHYPDHYLFMLCAFRTGMRLGELLGLAWEDVNAYTIEVRRAYSHGCFGTPKSHKTRLIEISDQLKMALRVHQQHLTQAFGGALPACAVPAGMKGGQSVHLVFPNERGRPMDGDNFRHRVFSKLLEKADVPKMRFHDCRHTYASLLLQTGAPVHYVKEQMGHASISTTVDIYGHVMPNANRNAVNKLDDLGTAPARPALAIAG